MDWFEELTGFKETSYQETKNKLEFKDGMLHCPTNQRQFVLGKFEAVSLQDLRSRCEVTAIPTHVHGLVQPLQVSEVFEDAYRLHCRPEAHQAVVQVASQFNLLEMASPFASPEDGITRYQHDYTQGPACAMAAGPATIYRNYGIWVGSQQGQTREKQLNMLETLAEVLDIRGLNMQNGYALIGREGLIDLQQKFQGITEARRETLKGLLKVGVHWGTSVTAPGAPENQLVTQVFCSALPVAYSSERDPDLWEPLARLVLEACYEATLRIAALNFESTGNQRVYLTRVGGGVFGNRQEWIDQAIEMALYAVSEYPLQVIHVKR